MGRLLWKREQAREGGRHALRYDHRIPIMLCRIAILLVRSLKRVYNFIDPDKGFIIKEV